MARKIIEHRIMQVGRLRSFCIKYDYFTLGTNEEYDAMFDLIRGGKGYDLQNDKLYDIAEAIWKNTPWETYDDIQVTDIMNALAREVVETYFEEDEENFDEAETV